MTKPTHGGKRTGSGRPEGTLRPSDGSRVSLFIDTELWKRLGEITRNKSRYISDLIRKSMEEKS